MNVDVGTDKAERPQEAISLRGVDTKKGEVVSAALGFQIYYFLFQMMLDAEDLAALQDEDFTHLGGLNQIHWAPTQTEQWRKLMPTF